MKVRRSVRRNQSGFTLIELVITLVIAAIVLTLGVPSFRQMIIDNRMTSQANLLVTSLNRARSEAINRAENVTVTSNAGTNWFQGWTVTTAGGTTLRSQGALEGDATLVGSASSITYASTGYPTGTVTSMTVDLCNADATSERQIAVVSGGRVNLNASYTCP